ncbi:MAG: CinA family protein [Candidatus Omnitrophota bacterium]
MERLIKQIHGLLIQKKRTISAAESCTGGMLSESLTRTPGSSKYFLLGVAAYSNKAKNKILKIPAPVIKKYGAVSKETAIMMAGSVKKLAGSDIGIGITGIAGPTGAAPGKPVGTVFIAIKDRDFGICKKLRFKGNRQAVRKLATLNSLELLYASLHRH